MKSVDVALARRAALQHGVVQRRHALALGMTARQIERRLEAGLLVPVHRGVYRLAASPPTWHQGVLAACMAGGDGALASHTSAAGLWALRGIEPASTEITVRGPHRARLSGVVVHRTDRLDGVDVSRRLGIPVTSPARTLLDLGAVVGVDVLEPALEDAILRRLVTFALVRRTVERLGRPGRRGTAGLRQLVEARDPATAPTESMLEDRLVAVLRRGGLRDPVRQHRVGGVRVDLAYPEARLAIEADSRVWHAGRGDVQRNSAKRNLLVGLGWRVLHFTWFDVTTRPAYVLATVAPQLANVA